MLFTDTLVATPVMNFALLDEIDDEDLPSDEEIASKQAHNLRIKHCGQTYGLKPNIKTGLWSRTRYFCGYARECPQCRQRKADKVEEELLEGGVAGLYVKECGEDEVQGICEALGTANYRRFPMEDGTYTLVYRDPEEVVVGGTPWQDSKINMYDLVVAPEHKRVTGKLGKKAPVAKDTKIKITTFVAPKVTDQEWNTITKKVFQMIKHFDPKDPETLQRVIENRAGLVEIKLKELGKQYWTKKTTEGINFEELRWAKEYTETQYDGID